MRTPFFKDSHPGIKIIFFLFTVVASISIFSIIGIIISVPLFGIDLSDFGNALNINNPDNMPFIKYMQFIQHFGIFVIPPIVAAYLFSENVLKYLKVRFDSGFILFLLAASAVVFSVPFINLSGFINAKLTLPESMSSLELKIKAMESSAEKMTEAFLNVNTFGGYIVNLLLIALLPAIGEELFFRGILLQLLRDWTKSVHAAVLITAVLFSAVHFQFYGFLPRFLLGALFGYLFVWSGNILMPVTAHFVNNALAVSLYYFAGGTEVYDKADKFGVESSSLPFLFISVFVLIFIMYAFYKLSGKAKDYSY
ncbi:MAG: CPBP family intramembrane metalloprotease [Chlorobi bacterium]|nr:CPBP family intramembrane metalloprotease [Chlorobiota bacterium]